MTIYRIESEELVEVERTTFVREGLKERNNLQSLIKSKIEVISPETLVVAEEFGEWEGSQRRIDLLGIDKSANLVVIELKRTEDGGHMDLQAIRYAAMVSTLTFEKLVPIYERYLLKNGINAEPAESLLKFLDWSEPDEDQFGQEVKIVLASAEFSKELTTSVMWLNELGLNIRCVRMHPYVSGGQTFLDVQTVIPIPEVADYQIRIREKKQKERESRESLRDFTRYDVRVSGMDYLSQSKRGMMFRLISAVLRGGGTPQQVMDEISWRRNRLFEVFDGTLQSDQVRDQIMKEEGEGAIPKVKRFFCNSGELFYAENKTYVLSNQWGKRSLEAVEALKKAFPELGIEIKPAE